MVLSALSADFIFSYIQGLCFYIASRIAREIINLAALKMRKEQQDFLSNPDHPDTDFVILQVL